MFKLETLIAIVLDVVRTLLVDTLSAGVTTATGRFRRGPKGMAAIHRHIHRQCRRKLFKRLST